MNIIILYQEKKNCEKIVFIFARKICYICEKIFFMKECTKAQLYLREIFFYICEKIFFIFAGEFFYISERIFFIFAREFCINECSKVQYGYNWVYMRMGFRCS